MSEYIPESASQIETLPAYRYVGPYREDPVTAVHTRYRNYESEASFSVEEQPKTPEQLQQITELNAALNDYARTELGVDLSLRLPRPERIHFFEEDKFEDLKAAVGLPAFVTAAANNADGHVISPEITGNNTEIQLHKVGHEIIHLVSSQNVRLVEQVDSEDKRTLVGRHISAGYRPSKTKAFRMFDEFVVEEMQKRVEGYWGQYDHLKGYEGSIEGYDYVMPVCRAFVNKVADDLGQSYEDVFRGLARGELTGEKTTLREISGVIGTEGMKVLAQYKSLDLESAREVAEKLGLNLSLPQKSKSTEIETTEGNTDYQEFQPPESKESFLKGITRRVLKKAGISRG